MMKQSATEQSATEQSAGTTGPRMPLELGAAAALGGRDVSQAGEAGPGQWPGEQASELETYRS